MVRAVAVAMGSGGVGVRGRTDAAQALGPAELITERLQTDDIRRDTGPSMSRTHAVPQRNPRLRPQSPRRRRHLVTLVGRERVGQQPWIEAAGAAPLARSSTSAILARLRGIVPV